MKDNFYLLLDRLENAENEEELTDEDFDELIGDIKGKIDGIKDFLSRCDYEQKRLDEVYIKPIQKRKKAIGNSSDRLKQWVVKAMEAHDMPLLHGDLFTVRIQENDAVKIADLEIDSSTYLKHKDVIKRKYEFDKTKIKNNLKNGASYKFAELFKNKFIKFTVKKGEKKK